jgi:hypothetical protein
MSYHRIIPRDLFNEAKLLKCLGQLSLYILDYAPRGLALDHENPEDGFRIEQNEDSGALYCSNLECLCAGRLIGLQSAYNSKDAYPLNFILDDEDGRVFDEDGKLSKEFKALVKSLTEGVRS